MKDIVIKDLSKSYNGRPVIEGFSAKIPAGSIFGIMGESGCGKTTLLRILLRLEKPDSGEIEGLPPRMAAVFQEDRLCDEFSPIVNVAIAAPRKTEKNEIVSCLLALGLENEALSRPVGSFSGGMRRRTAIARALMAGQELILLDEPFKGLDEGTRAQVIAVVRRRTQGKTVVLVTHEKEEIDAMGATLCVLESKPPSSEAEK